MNYFQRYIIPLVQTYLFSCLYSTLSNLPSSISSNLLIKTISPGKNWTDILEFFYPQMNCTCTCFHLGFFVHQFTGFIQSMSQVVVVDGTVDNPYWIHFMFQWPRYKPPFTFFTLIDLDNPKILFSFPSFNNIFTLARWTLYIFHHYFITTI